MTRRPVSSHTSHTDPDSPTRRDESGVVAPSRVMLVAIVLVAVAAVTYVAGLGSGPGEADVATTASARQAPTAGGSTADATGSASASPSPSATTSPSPSASTKPKAKATEKSAPKASASPSSPATAQATQVQRGQVSVSVFNNSSRTGLAARTSDKVKSAGWKVIGTDNWYGSIPQPTVYYPARLKAAAELLAKDAGIDRVKPAVSPMRSDRLTLIVTGDYRL